MSRPEHDPRRHCPPILIAKRYERRPTFLHLLVGKAGPREGLLADLTDEPYLLLEGGTAAPDAVGWRVVLSLRPLSACYRTFSIGGEPLTAEPVDEINWTGLLGESWELTTSEAERPGT